jgi:hypothetical protein
MMSVCVYFKHEQLLQLLVDTGAWYHSANLSNVRGGSLAPLWWGSEPTDIDTARSARNVCHCDGCWISRGLCNAAILHAELCH